MAFYPRWCYCICLLAVSGSSGTEQDLRAELSATHHRKGLFRCQLGVSVPACLRSPWCPKGIVDLGFCWFPACGGFPGRVGHGSGASSAAVPGAGGVTHQTWVLVSSKPSYF